MIYAIRHGETDWNLKEIMQGQTDNPLNDTGRKQAKASIKEIAKLKINYIFSSDLIRAKETAEIINKDLGLDITFDNRIREFCFGSIEGKNKSEMTEEIWLKFRSDPKAFGAETLPEIYERVKSFLDELKTKNLGNVLLVTHGGAMRMFLFCSRHDVFDIDEYAKNYRHMIFQNTCLIELK